MKNWKKGLGSNNIEEQSYFSLSWNKGKVKNADFFTSTPPEKKGRLRQENSLAVFDFANTIPKSRCIIKVSESENCKYCSRLRQHEGCLNGGSEAAAKTRWGVLFWFRNLQQVWHTHRLINFSERFKMPASICLQSFFLQTAPSGLCYNIIEGS